MSHQRTQYSSSAPPMSISIQPPPFLVTIPGPSMYSGDQPLHIEQCNPCAPCLPAITNVPCTSYANAASRYSQKFLQQNQNDCHSCQ